MQTKNRKGIIWALVLFIAVATIAHYANGKKDKQAAIDSKQKIDAARDAVSVLPQGTEDAWDAYVDRRLAATLHRSGSTIQLLGGVNEMMGKTVLLSVNSPYQILCEFGGGSIKFGYAQQAMTCPNGEEAEIDDDNSVYIYGAFADSDPSAEKPPPLGVYGQSIAAKELQKRLCQRIADKVQAIMAPQGLPDGGAK